MSGLAMLYKHKTFGRIPVSTLGIFAPSSRETSQHDFNLAA